MEYQVSGSVCPNCKTRLNGAVSVGHDSAPKPGDFTVCSHCGEYLVFGPDCALQRLSETDIREAPLIILAKVRAAVFAAKET